MEWKFLDDIPIYLQIIERIKVDIVSGRYASGDKLPAVRDLATEAGVNQELERQGLVQSERTSGRYVSIDDEKKKELQRDLSQDCIRKLFEDLRNLGMDDQMIKDAVGKWEE